MQLYKKMPPRAGPGETAVHVTTPIVCGGTYFMTCCYFANQMPWRVSGAARKVVGQGWENVPEQLLSVAVAIARQLGKGREQYSAMEVRGCGNVDRGKEGMQGMWGCGNMGM